MFDRDLIYAYCQPITNLFCGAVYCVVGQVSSPLAGRLPYIYQDKDGLLNRTAPHIAELEEEGNIQVYSKIITPTLINQAGLQVSEYIRQNLRMLVWRYAYKNKISRPKLCLGNSGMSFDAAYLDYIEGSPLELELIKAVAHIKRHSLIDTYYQATYRDCDLLRNYGILSVSALHTLKQADYKSNFFLQPSLLLGLPIIMKDAFTYVPTPLSEGALILSELQGKQEEALYCLFDREVKDLPNWWYLVQDAEHPDLTLCDEYTEARSRGVFAKLPKKFKDWLLERSSKLDKHCQPMLEELIAIERRQQHRASTLSREALPENQLQLTDYNQDREDTLGTS